MVYYLKDLPFTEEGKKLNLPNEDRERFRLVYKKQGEDWILHDIFGKGGEYGDDCIVVPLESAYRGYWILDPGQEFANVIGSGDDHPPRGIQTWIGLWKYMYSAINHGEPPTICCTDGNEYQAINADQYVCRGNICNFQYPAQLEGGHVILGKAAARVDEGHLVYIVPICHGHNSMSNLNFMRIGPYPTFAVLLSYQIEQRLRDYLAQHPLETHEKI